VAVVRYRPPGQRPLSFFSALPFLWRGSKRLFFSSGTRFRRLPRPFTLRKRPFSPLNSRPAPETSSPGVFSRVTFLSKRRGAACVSHLLAVSFLFLRWDELPLVIIHRLEVFLGESPGKQRSSFFCPASLERTFLWRAESRRLVLDARRRALSSLPTVDLRKGPPLPFPPEEERSPLPPSPETLLSTLFQ